MKASVVLLSLMMIPFSHAATLKGDNGVEILAIDGKEVESGFFASKGPELSEGDHQVVVRYSNNFKKGETVESKPHLFNIDIKGDTEISIRNFHNQHQAEKEIKQGVTWIVTNNEQTLEIAGSDTLSGKGYLPYSDIEKLITDYNQEHGISLNSVATVPVTTTSVMTAGSNLTTSNVSQAKTEQLIQIYNSATKEERKAFRIWLLEQDMK